MMTKTFASLFVLNVWYADATLGDFPAFIDTRPMTYAQCEYRAKQEVEFYFFLRNAEVKAFCIKLEKNDGR